MGNTLVLQYLHEKMTANRFHQSEPTHNYRVSIFLTCGLLFRLLYIAVVSCVMIGQLHADKCDNHAISR